MPMIGLTPAALALARSRRRRTRCRGRSSRSRPCPSSAVRSNMSPSRAAPSSMEYSVCTCRWTNPSWPAESRMERDQPFPGSEWTAASATGRRCSRGRTSAYVHPVGAMAWQGRSGQSSDSETSRTVTRATRRRALVMLPTPPPSGHEGDRRECADHGATTPGPPVAVQATADGGAEDAGARVVRRHVERAPLGAEGRGHDGRPAAGDARAPRRSPRSGPRDRRSPGAAGRGRVRASPAPMTRTDDDQHRGPADAVDRAPGDGGGERPGEVGRGTPGRSTAGARSNGAAESR